MPTAKLLSKDTVAAQSLSQIVENSQGKPPPFQDYDLKLNSNQLEFIPATKSNQYFKLISQDEGFESDIDTLSIISSDDSFASSTCLVDDHVLKNQENDSANGSSSSDSDTEIVPERLQTETFRLHEVLCYTDVNYPKILMFCVQDVVYVFGFDNIETLQHLYTSFNTLKAVFNQRTYNKNIQTKYNLLHRTDNNGVTHIQISKETEVLVPETVGRTRESLDTNEGKGLKKVWKSAEDLLGAPKKPERKRRQKGKAPQPPVAQKPKEDITLETKSPQILRYNHVQMKSKPDFSSSQMSSVQLPNQNVMKGQFVRVSVDPKRPPERPSRIEDFQTFPTNLQTFSPNWRPSQSPFLLSSSRPKPAKPEVLRSQSNWTNSVPRILKPRSRSESRTPMAYRYIDTTDRPPQFHTNSATISNRLFGLSQKLKELGGIYDSNPEASRRGSLGETSNYKSELKSVIKKEDNKKSGRDNKKVTFSAYATVQVV